MPDRENRSAKAKLCWTGARSESSLSFEVRSLAILPIFDSNPRQRTLALISQRRLPVCRRPLTGSTNRVACVAGAE